MFQFVENSKRVFWVRNSAGCGKQNTNSKNFEKIICIDRFVYTSNRIKKHWTDLVESGLIHHRVEKPIFAGYQIKNHQGSEDNLGRKS